jgi:hypothetical protein
MDFNKYAVVYEPYRYEQFLPVQTGLWVYQQPVEMIALLLYVAIARVKRTWYVMHPGKAVAPFCLNLHFILRQHCGGFHFSIVL